MNMGERTLPAAVASKDETLSERPETPSAARKILIVVDPRSVIRGCLGSWITSLGAEFEVITMADVGASLRSGALRHATAVIFSTGRPALSLQDGWLPGQVAEVHEHRPELPIVLIAEPGEVVPAEVLARQLHLSGYIPTSSSMDLAAAALRLIVAGGSYIPPDRRDPDVTLPAEPAMSMPPQAAPPPTRLTLREQAVLTLLERGLPNKVIGDRLGMSPSTVKAHVHNIITKLNVRNRTEAAVARFAHVSTPMSAILHALPFTPEKVLPS